MGRGHLRYCLSILQRERPGHFPPFDRLRKFGAFIDRGELVFDEEQQKYIGRDLSGHYLCGEEEHRVLSLEISIKAGRVSGFTEVYEPIGEEESARYIDTVMLEVTGFHIELPEKIYTPEDIEKLPSFAELLIKKMKHTVLHLFYAE